MISIVKLLFWLCLATVTYSYVLYPILLLSLAALVQTVRDLRFLVGRHNRRPTAVVDSPPSVALMVAAYNEQDVIEAKIRNTMALLYQPGQLNFLLGLDAITDETGLRAERSACPFLKVFYFPTRQGKLGVLCELAKETTADILVFSDANTMLSPDCLQKLVRHFRDPQVGAVSGEEIRIDKNSGAPMASAYWRYETVLKFFENRLNCTLGANGAIYAVRRQLFQPGRGWVVEDFQIPMEIRYSGYRVIYDPEAVAYEESAPTLNAEFGRKIRIGAGDFQTFFRNPRFLNPLNGLPALAYWSHKVLRWFTPLLLITIVLSNFFLLTKPAFVYIMAVQLSFYLSALLGYWQDRLGRRPRLLSIPLYFCLMNLALFLGLIRYLSGRQKAVWGVTQRQVSPDLLITQKPPNTPVP